MIISTKRQQQKSADRTLVVQPEQIKGTQLKGLGDWKHANICEDPDGQDHHA